MLTPPRILGAIAWHRLSPANTATFLRWGKKMTVRLPLRVPWSTHFSAKGGGRHPTKNQMTCQGLSRTVKDYQGCPVSRATVVGVAIRGCAFEPYHLSLRGILNRGAIYPIYLDCSAYVYNYLGLYT